MEAESTIIHHQLLGQMLVLVLTPDISDNPFIQRNLPVFNTGVQETAMMRMRWTSIDHFPDITLLFINPDP